MKSTRIAYFLWFIGGFGWFGFHRFYLRKFGTGLIWMFTGGFLGLGALVDLFTLGDQVRQYNLEQELDTIRSATNSLGKIMSYQTNQRIQSNM